VEIGDWTRSAEATIGSCISLVPCESSSGASQVQGRVTKTGNGHARRLVIVIRLPGAESRSRR